MKTAASMIFITASVIATQTIAADLKGSIRMGLLENESAAMDQVKISIVEAIEIAKKRIDGRVIEAELENEEGYLVWEIEVLDGQKQEHELLIDPVTGDVLSQVRR